MLRKEGNNKSIGIKVFSLKMRRRIMYVYSFVHSLMVLCAFSLCEAKFSYGEMVAIYFQKHIVYNTQHKVNVTA